MKKFDYLIIALMFMFVTLVYIFIYRPYISNSSKKLDLIINNEQIDEFYIYEEITYEIKTIDNKIMIYKNNKLFKSIDSYNYKNIYNKISITKNTVKVIESNCVHKDCMYMEINNNYKLPIICTNGITIKYKNKINNNQSDIII